QVAFLHRDAGEAEEQHVVAAGDVEQRRLADQREVVRRAVDGTEKAQLERAAAGIVAQPAQRDVRDRAVGGDGMRVVEVRDSARRDGAAGLPLKAAACHALAERGAGKYAENESENEMTH